MLAFADNKPADAYRLYHEARALAEPDDLRILNGLYTTSWRTGRKKEAAETFGKIVGVGLDAKKLPIKMFFNPGTTTLLQSADLQAQYAVWLREVAPRSGRTRAAFASSATPAGPATRPPTRCSRRSARRSSSRASSGRTASSRRASRPKASARAR